MGAGGGGLGLSGLGIGLGAWKKVGEYDNAEASKEDANDGDDGEFFVL